MFLTKAEAETGVNVPVHWTPAPDVAEADAEAEADIDAVAVAEVTSVVAEALEITAELVFAEETDVLVAAVPGTHWWYPVHLASDRVNRKQAKVFISYNHSELCTCIQMDMSYRRRIPCHHLC